MKTSGNRTRKRCKTRKRGKTYNRYKHKTHGGLPPPPEVANMSIMLEMQGLRRRIMDATTTNKERTQLKKEYMNAAGRLNAIGKSRRNNKN